MGRRLALLCVGGGRRHVSSHVGPPGPKSLAWENISEAKELAIPMPPWVRVDGVVQFTFNF
ncbi:hypothetical protein D187_002728 [Cystobacter fuscus DSM 2262]|uniref:Uncharacterized protein n=1 Tax=Cystobacter fuscus (strain ATCC 25194 / DSM 2262 / NBRC 100088 / M29) TaxID=1242864 RepID=S9PBC7_CYSF2|nr:hypothetical protein D187_002728 [Cystobacter fuscus DSM 2262]